MTAHNEDEFDNLLDHALSEYRDAEPLAGIEDRILARLHQRETTRQRFGWRWAIAFSCAALAVIVVGITLGGPLRQLLAGWGGAHKPASPKQTVAAQKPVAPPPATQENPTRNIHRVPRTPSVPIEVAATPEPMPAQFPMPTQLTPEERAFMAALQKDSAAMPAASDEPITIAEIEIKPLSRGGSSSEISGEKQ